MTASERVSPPRSTLAVSSPARSAASASARRRRSSSGSRATVEGGVAVGVAAAGAGVGLMSGLLVDVGPTGTVVAVASGVDVAVLDGCTVGTGEAVGGWVGRLVADAAGCVGGAVAMDAVSDKPATSAAEVVAASRLVAAWVVGCAEGVFVATGPPATVAIDDAVMATAAGCCVMAGDTDDCASKASAPDSTLPRGA